MTSIADAVALTIEPFVSGLLIIWGLSLMKKSWIQHKELI